MKKNIRITLILIVLFTFCTGPLSAMSDKVIAVVEGEPITLEDLQSYFNSIYLQLAAQGVSQQEVQKVMSTLKQDGLERLIEQKLLIIEADKQGLEIRETAIDKQIENIRSQYPTEQMFTDALAQEGITITELRQKIENQLKAKYVVEVAVSQTIAIQPQDVTEYYEKNIDQFRQEERRDINSIFISFEDDPDAAREKANQASARLKTENFEDVAKDFSETPSIGIVEKGKFLPALETIIFNLNEGEISAPFEIETGIYIFQVKEKLPAETVSIEEVKDKITSMLYQEKFKQKFTSWMEELKDQAYIEIKKM